MTKHEWLVVGVMSQPEYVVSFPKRRDITILPEPHAWAGLTLVPSPGQTLIFLCTACGLYANGEEGKGKAEPCDVAKVRRILEA